jgi:hypothetical protein
MSINASIVAYGLVQFSHRRFAQIITGTFLIAGVEIVEAASKQADDDQVIDAGKQLEQIPMGLVVFLMLISIVLHGFGVQGAIAYTKWMVYAAMGSYALNLVLAVFQFNIVAIMINLSLVYPHFYFIKEMNENIMSTFPLLAVLMFKIAPRVSNATTIALNTSIATQHLKIIPMKCNPAAVSS